MKKLMLALIRFYQRRISPAYPRRCRYWPTCSEYAAQAIGRYGALRGGAMAAKRICRCQPFSKRDYFDPVPERPNTQKRETDPGRTRRPITTVYGRTHENEET